MITSIEVHSRSTNLLIHTDCRCHFSTFNDDSLRHSLNVIYRVHCEGKMENEHTSESDQTIHTRRGTQQTSHTHIVTVWTNPPEGTDVQTTQSEHNKDGSTSTNTPKIIGDFLHPGVYVETVQWYCKIWTPGIVSTNHINLSQEIKAKWLDTWFTPQGWLSVVAVVFDQDGCPWENDITGGCTRYLGSHM